MKNEVSQVTGYRLQATGREVKLVVSRFVLLRGVEKNV